MQQRDRFCAPVDEEHSGELTGELVQAGQDVAGGPKRTCGGAETRLTRHSGAERIGDQARPRGAGRLGKSMHRGRKIQEPGRARGVRRQFRVACRPVGQAAGELIAALRGVHPCDLRCGEAARRVRGADDAVGPARREARDQPGPPRAEDMMPSRFRDLRAEVRLPVGGPGDVAEALPPVVAGDPVATPGCVIETLDVPVEPRSHRGGPAEAHQGLRGHRAVIGQAAAELRAGPGQPA